MATLVNPHSISLEIVTYRSLYLLKSGKKKESGKLRPKEFDNQSLDIGHEDIAGLPGSDKSYASHPLARQLVRHPAAGTPETVFEEHSTD